MKRNILTFALFIILFSACEDEDPVQEGTGSLALIFKARYGNEPLVQGQLYDYFGLGQILFSTADLFISDLKLIGANDTVLIKDVDYISLMSHHTTTAAAEQGLWMVYEGVKTGNYNSLQFNIGINAAQNQTKPANYVASHPLANGTRYWAGWNSYIFTKTEGVFQQGVNHSFTYHSGFDNTLKTVHLNRDISVFKDLYSSITVYIDYKKMFDDNGTPMDIPANPQIHSMSFIMLNFMDRYQNAVSF